MQRPLTDGERALARGVFGDAMDYDSVSVFRRRWFPFQPRNILMAPTGNLHIHPGSDLWSEDFSEARVGLRGLFLHELTHVWQSQQRGRFYLPLMRHPFCRYRYRIEPGRPFARYGLEQQAEMVRHLYLQRHGHTAPGAAPLPVLEQLVPFD